MSVVFPSRASGEVLTPLITTRAIDALSVAAVLNMSPAIQLSKDVELEIATYVWVAHCIMGMEGHSGPRPFNLDIKQASHAFVQSISSSSSAAEAWPALTQSIDPSSSRSADATCPALTQSIGSSVSGEDS
jgi:hypothetical protein